MALAFITERDVMDWLSAEGLELRADHTATALQVANDSAIGEVEFFLADRYSLAAADVLASRWLKQVVLILTIFHLCSQRNDQPPGNITQLREEYLARLEQIREGVANLPGAIIGSKGAPVMLNMSVNHDAYPSIFVDRARSVIPDNPRPTPFRPWEYTRPPRT